MILNKTSQVICNRCDAMLIHSSLDKKSTSNNSSHIRKYVQSANCIKIANNRDLI